VTSFEEILSAANAGDLGRVPGSWAPLACKVWKEAPPEMARMLEAAFAWELKNKRRARSQDEGEVRDLLRQMDAVTAAVRAVKAE